MEWKRDDLLISDDKSLIDIDVVRDLLSTAYWATSRTKETIIKSIEHSICFGVYVQQKQIGFARVITDKAVFSWILDVIISEEFRGKKIGHWLIECILEHPDMKHTGFGLRTDDAHEFYKKFNFTIVESMKRPIVKGEEK